MAKTIRNGKNAPPTAREFATGSAAGAGRAIRIALACTLALNVTASAALARYGGPPGERVPFDRLIQNLEAALRAKPKDAGTLLNLARAHAQAYATHQPEANVLAGTHAPTNGGMPDNGIPRLLPGQDAAAKAHLAEAIRVYQELVAVEPKHELGRLGLGWALLQAGRKPEAALVLRALEADTFARDSAAQHDGPPIVVASEAGSYLIEALDGPGDAAERATIEEHVKKLEGLQTWKSPIALALAPGATLASIQRLDAAVSFDVDGTNRGGTWSWISPDAGWLVWLPEPRGTIATGRQLFGEVTFALVWRDGYEALAALDDDRDGVLRGAELTGMGVWRDLDGDGRCAPTEVVTLEAAGIVGLACRALPGADPHVLAHCPQGAMFRDGTTRPTIDLLLKWSPARMSVRR